MAENTVQSLNKLLVDVPVGKGEAFKDTYYYPTEDRRTDYDNKVVFLHDSHEIFTQGDLFGVQPTVGLSNSFGINGTTYTLTINNGVLNIEKYVPSSFTNNTKWYNTTVSGGGTQVYQTTYQLSITPSNKFTANINAGTTRIAITGVKVKDTINTSYTYVYGNEATINNGIAYVNDTQVNYSNSGVSINTDYTLDSTNVHYKSAKSETGTLTSNSKSISVDIQTAVVYYHEMNTNTIQGKTIDSTPNKVTVNATYEFLHLVAEEWNEQSALKTRQKQLPITSNITFTFVSNTCYGWFACPTSWILPEPETGMPVSFTQYDAQGNKGATGGWFYALDTNGNKIRFQHAGTEYTLFRTDNVVTETTYYRVSK